MAASPQDQLATMMANIPAKTGKSLADWQALIAGTDLAKHGQIVKFLKTDHGVTHGFANLIANQVLAGDAPAQDDLVAAQYAGPKAGLRPLYDAIVAFAKTLGPDVEIAPKKSSVSLRRAKQFALITPATKTHIDLGLALKGTAPVGRLVTYNAMCSHKIRLAGDEALDDEAKRWLSEAFVRAGG